MNDNFCPSHTVVELDTWERGPVFRHFIDDLRCVMSLTVDLEISRFLKRLSASGFRFYPAMIWAVSNVLNAHAEFRYGWDDQGRLVLWDRIEPYYAHFHPDRETFAKLVTCRPTPLMCRACPGSGTAASTCTSSTAAPIWPRWSPGENMNGRETGRSCPSP